MYQVSRHKSGLSVITATMPHMASVSLGMWVAVGGRYEPASLCGVSHFIEHLLFKGTRARSARQISQDVEGIGGYLNAFTTEETTCFYSKARHDRFQELLDVLMDMFLNSTFDPVEIAKERNVIKEELAMYLDQPQHHVQELLNEMLWPNQPLGRSLTGTAETIEKMTREELLAYRSTNYLSSSTIVAAAGNLNHDKVVKAVSRFARHFLCGNRPKFIPAFNKQTKPAICLFTKPAEQTQLALGIRTCSRHDERRFALRLLNTVLGENMSSRLFQVVREDHGLAYSITSALCFFDDVGALNISAGVDTDKLPRALKLIIRELQRLMDEFVTPAELRCARDYVIGQIDLGLESTENQMMWAAEQLLSYGRIIPAAEIKQKLRDVKASQIRSVARDFFRPDRLNLALVSPLKSDAGMRRCLRADDWKSRERTD
ncbi:MAG: insulinase family protein [Verrucomicrobia bacterium]|nr:insulinase family protein [Verrucomicrobiota bacterium]